MPWAGQGKWWAMLSGALIVGWQKATQGVCDMIAYRYWCCLSSKASSEAMMFSDVQRVLSCDWDEPIHCGRTMARNKNLSET